MWRKKRGVLFVVGLLVLVSASFLGVQYKADIAHALKLATTRQPERFTELYIADPRQLPKNLRPGQPAQVSFVIGNQEARATSYRYEVDFVKNGQTIASRSGTVDVADGETTVQTVSLPPQPDEGELLTIIRLPDHGQSIHFRSQISL